MFDGYSDDMVSLEVFVHVRMYARVCVCVRGCLSVRACLHVYVRACLCVRVCDYITYVHRFLFHQFLIEDYYKNISMLLY